MLFVCDKCNTVDDTSLVDISEGFLCSCCKNGEWHEVFTQKQFDPTEHTSVVNRPGAALSDGSEPSFS